MSLREDHLDFLGDKRLYFVATKVIHNKVGCCKRGMLQQPLFVFRNIQKNY